MRAGLAKTSSNSTESSGTAPDCRGSSTPGHAECSQLEVDAPDCGSSSAPGHSACSKPEVEVPLPACEIPEAPADPNWKRRRNEEWVRPFLPHGLADFDCHLGTGVEGQIEWVARYSLKDPDKHPLSGEVPKQYRTKSVTCTQMKCPTDHSVFLVRCTGFRVGKSQALEPRVHSAYYCRRGTGGNLMPRAWELCSMPGINGCTTSNRPGK